MKLIEKSKIRIVAGLSLLSVPAVAAASVIPPVPVSEPGPLGLLALAGLALLLSSRFRKNK